MEKGRKESGTVGHTGGEGKQENRVRMERGDSRSKQMKGGTCIHIYMFILGRGSNL